MNCSIKRTYTTVFLFNKFFTNHLHLLPKNTDIMHFGSHGIVTRIRVHPHREAGKLIEMITPKG